MRLLLLPIVLALSACSLTPALVKPEPPVPAAYPMEPAQAERRPAADIGWHAMFGDPRLRQLIELALRNNRDLRLATLNLEAVGAEYRIGRAGLFPTVEAGAGASRERASDPMTGSPPWSRKESPPSSA